MNAKNLFLAFISLLDTQYTHFCVLDVLPVYSLPILLPWSIENAGYPIGLPNWGTYFGTPKKSKSIKIIDNVVKVINN